MSGIKEKKGVILILKNYKKQKLFTIKSGILKSSVEDKIKKHLLKTNLMKKRFTTKPHRTLRNT